MNSMQKEREFICFGRKKKKSGLLAKNIAKIAKTTLKGWQMLFDVCLRE